MKEATKKKVIKVLSIGLKVTGVVGAGAVIAGVFGGCPTEVEEKPYYGPVTITESITLDNGITVSVRATLFPHEIGPVKDKLKAAFDKAAADDLTIAGYIVSMLNAGTTIELKIEDYHYYKFDRVARKFFFNTNHVINAVPDALATTVTNIIKAAYNEGPPIQAKALPVHDKGWQKMNGEAVKLANAATKRKLGNCIA